MPSQKKNMLRPVSNPRDVSPIPRDWRRRFRIPSPVHPIPSSGREAETRADATVSRGLGTMLVGAPAFREVNWNQKKSSSEDEGKTTSEEGGQQSTSSGQNSPLGGKPRKGKQRQTKEDQMPPVLTAAAGGEGSSSATTTNDLFPPNNRNGNSTEEPASTESLIEAFGKGRYVVEGDGQLRLKKSRTVELGRKIKKWVCAHAKRAAELSRKCVRKIKDGHVSGGESSSMFTTSSSSTKVASNKKMTTTKKKHSVTTSKSRPVSQ